MSQGAVQSSGRTATDAATIFFNRELSWLSFNLRVLAEARNPDYPLLERLRFLSISGSNLDEFMSVRVAGLAGQVRRQIEEMSIDGRTPSQQLLAIRDAVLALESGQQEVWRSLHSQLAAFFGSRPGALRKAWRGSVQSSSDLCLPPSWDQALCKA